MLQAQIVGTFVGVMFINMDLGALLFLVALLGTEK
jgi:hypothetical protein